MHALSNMDLAAAAWFLFAWLGFNLLIDVSPLRKKTLSSAMETYRRGWMRAMSLREVRIMDTSIMSGLQQGTAFFASTSLLAIGGGFALLDATERIVQVAGDLSIPVADSRALWEIKVLALMLIFAYGFFKFGWAYRLFNYASIVMGAVPQQGQAPDEVIAKMAAQAGELGVLAGRHFNRGQRALFFSIGFLGWFAGPYVFAATTLAVLLVLLRRQFVSKARAAVLLGQYPNLGSADKSGEYTDTGSSNPFT
ncbi:MULTISPECIES: DUF599 family protein [Stappiaceae]|jgi:uncharacterized membrane protein|uniref:DUF599 domain-containing protein n=1 Tax=Stappiaceae TaxID=2821832 RepID=UPI00094B7569|nr:MULTISPECIES: DUF599 family protein [Stappiaceae]MCR9282808.1 DUF599 family protein [Paracoccaceae bacterium]MEC9418006.1 DUF599 family protein [Pseudomonadota bacterium]MBN8182682.1 DUF599 family protein [Roseibium aggregatum]MEE2865324.1 DUF599 family protein [Pseudomonadota bacterium]NKI62036.1 DUF599 family protein [Labrenzia sp. PO1]